ncbi:MAG: class I SAM-dependent methyltransferase [Phycisphaerales bacterium]
MTASTRHDDWFRIEESDIRRVANARGPRVSLVTIVVRQAWAEFHARVLDHAEFRRRRNELATEGYHRMSVHDFSWVNARQAWANWRTIPRSLRAAALPSPVAAIDLCCGVGDSTAVLAAWLPSGSSILGLDVEERFIEFARSRDFRDRAGEPAQVEFRAQSVLEPFTEARGERLQDSSVDLINSCGAVGCHFDLNAVHQLVEESDRVLRPGGVAMMDAGPHGVNPDQLREIWTERGFEFIQMTRSCSVDRSRHVSVRKPRPKSQ